MKTEHIECDVVVVGAGVIGLAIADKLTPVHTVVVVEAHNKFGQETSSRNSEVIHSGIYYPIGSKKTEMCIRGRELLYHFCKHYSVPFKKTGKFVVAADRYEVDYLDELCERCKRLSVPHERWTKERLAEVEPLIQVSEAVYLPETGIIDSHSYMAALERFVLDAEGIIAYRHSVKKIYRDGTTWVVLTETPEGRVEIRCQKVVNAAGLAAAELTNQTFNTNRYQHKFCRGRYFSLPGKYQNRFSHLIYPVPPQDGLGIHVTIDLDGFARLGPDVDWCSAQQYQELESVYDCDWNELRPVFAKAVNRYCMYIEPGELAPGLIGVRPKLYVNQKPQPDFLIENLEGFIHCLGIESPGLTASQAIAEAVAKLTA